MLGLKSWVSILINLQADAHIQEMQTNFHWEHRVILLVINVAVTSCGFTPIALSQIQLIFNITRP